MDQNKTEMLYNSKDLLEWQQVLWYRSKMPWSISYQ